MTHFLFVLLLAFYLLPLPILARPTTRIPVGRQDFSAWMDSNLIFDLTFSLTLLFYAWLATGMTVAQLFREFVPHSSPFPSAFPTSVSPLSSSGPRNSAPLTLAQPPPAAAEVAPLIQSRPFLEGECKAEGLEGRGVLKAVVVIP
ncbi:hypothetical protein EDB92DRAFT_1949008 [Lactarius akahatsu]|uniref:Uncharacterized protein n=1 Tax=Lactarius akahatsu TaxID=416441 RepID=A0AAD4LCK0_9AGAM|nr:hypothetical protein EDB92DRAFT_1949008 [Lactarius akahatsu]